MRAKPFLTRRGKKENYARLAVAELDGDSGKKGPPD